MSLKCDLIFYGFSGETREFTGNGALQLSIIKSAAYNFYSAAHVPAKAHDGDTSTFYVPQHRNKTIVWIKFYLDGTYLINKVKIINRLDGHFDRLRGTSAYVYKSDPEARVALCGTIAATGITNSLEEQTYILDCNRASGDMIYLTDSDGYGPNFSEIEIFADCKYLRCKTR